MSESEDEDSSSGLRRRGSGTATDTALVVRIGVLHIAFYKRFLSAHQIATPC